MMENNLVLSLAQGMSVGSIFGLYSRSLGRAIVHGMFSSAVSFIASRIFGEIGFIGSIGLQGLIFIINADRDHRIELRRVLRRERLIIIREIVRDPRILRILQANQLHQVLSGPNPVNRMREIIHLHEINSTQINLPGNLSPPAA